MRFSKLLAVFFSSCVFSFGGIDRFLNDAIIELENPQVIKTQERGYFWGGGIRIRTPNMTVTPFVIKMPRLDAGCSGLDLVFGGFSFLNFEYLVQFLERTLQAAPAFAFSMALNALCDSCESILMKLNNLANQINSMSFSSCQLAKLIGYKVGKWAGEVLKENVVSGIGDSWLEEVNKKLDSFSALFSDFQQHLSFGGCTGQCLIQKLYDSNPNNSFVVKVLRETYFNEDDYIYMARALFGDMVVYRKPGAKDDEGFTIRLYAPELQAKEIEEFVKSMIYGTGVGGGGGGGIACADSFEFQSFDISSDGNRSRIKRTSSTFCGLIRSRLQGILEKFKNRTPLSDDEVQFLAAFRIPAYRILNILSIEPSLMESIANDMVNLLGADLTYAFLSSLGKELNRYLVALESDDYARNTIVGKDEIKEMKNNINLALTTTYNYVVREYSLFNEKIKNLNEWKMLEARIMAAYASHPVVGAYLFTKVLPGF